MINAELVKELKNKMKVYFDGEKLLSSLLAGDIVFKNYDGILQTGENRGYLVIESEDSEIYYYEDGVYISNGEQRIREIAQWFLGDKSSSHRIAEVVSAVKNFSQIRVKRENINRYPNLVNLNNCIVNIDTLEEIPHSKDYYFTTKLHFDYKKDAKCPLCIKFFNEVHNKDDIPLIQEIFGYCLYPTYIYNNIFFLIGLGGNGKGTELRLLTKFLGRENISSNTIDDLYTDPYAIADLFGKLANINGDIGCEPIKTEIINRASGMDDMRGQHKFGHAFLFTNYAKLIYATNNPPPIKDRSDGIWRRLVFIDFPNSFKGENCDVNLDQKLQTQEELSGLFNWAILGLKRLKKQGRVSFNLTTEQTILWYDRKASPVLSYAQDILEYSEGSYLIKTTVRRSFSEYCKKHKLREVGEAWFTKKLVDAMPGCDPDRPMIDGDRIQIYRNIKFKDDDSDQRVLSPSIAQPQQKLNFDQSLDDKINNILNDIGYHDNEITLEQLHDDGFDESFISQCMERKIIHQRPDGKISAGG